MKRLFVSAIFICIVFFSFSQEGKRSKEFPRFRKEESKINRNNVVTAFKISFGMQADDELRLDRSETDQLGFVHDKFQQYYKKIKVEGAVYSAHSRNNIVESYSGEYKGIKDFDVTPSISASQGLQSAISHVGAKIYAWESSVKDGYPDYEYPKGELVIIGGTTDDEIDLTLAWKYDIYAADPLYRAEVYINAKTGEFVKENNLIHNFDVAASGTTLYNGIQSFTADLSGTTYRLRQHTSGGGVQTYNLHNATLYSVATDFTTTDPNSWDDATAIQAHWGAERTYAFYYSKLGRNSFNNAGAIIKSYVHYSSNYVNAFWDGSRMTYGDGDQSQGYRPLVSLDICGHEITHGVTTYEANLTFSNESGALNESFSDIFGECIENFAEGTNDWMMGCDIGVSGCGAFRSMLSPNEYGDPDTYKGTNWYTGTSDYGGVHTNSGVQNKWFYILTVGESGVNDNGYNYNVSGIGLDKALKIAYRNLTVYLSYSSDFAAAREGAIQAAADLFGDGSPEYIATTEAWNAVGVYCEVLKTYIPDDNFEQALIDLGYDNWLDDYVLTSNISAVTNLNISNKNIADLTGIEDFTNLKSLNCSTNLLTSLDISQNLELTYLSCSDNNISELDVSHNTSLQYLFCSDNNLTSLNVLNNPSLLRLDCGINQIEGLDVYNNAALTQLYCHSNKLTHIDVTHNTALTNFICENNKITSLDLSQNTALTSLNCGKNQLSILNLSDNTALTELECHNNQLSSLDVSQNMALIKLICFVNKITELNLSLNIALTSFDCGNNQLVKLDVRNGNNVNFTTFNAVNNNLSCISLDDETSDHSSWILDPGIILSNNCALNTQRGENVTTVPIDERSGTTPIKLTFQNVTLSGNTALDITNSGTEIPEGFLFGNPVNYFDIETTAQYSGNITVVIDYSNMVYENEASLRLFHYVNGSWTDVTTSVDKVNKKIYGDVTSLSTFAVLQDNKPPTVITKDLTVPLDAFGNASINASEIDNGSTDENGIASMSLDKTEFSCSQIGENIVNLIVTDIYNNSAIGTAIVRVEDNTQPTISCQSGDSRYSDPGQTYYTVNGTEFDATASDACGIKSLMYSCETASEYMGTSLAGVMLSLGENYIEWRATDGHNNHSYCTTVVTVGKRQTKVTYTGDLKGLYSDVTDLKATLVDLVGNPVEGKTITFTIGTQSASGVTDADGVAITTFHILLAPGNYPVIAEFEDDEIYSGDMDEKMFVIAPEVACGVYDGTLFVSANDPNGGTGIVNLKVIIRQDEDGNLGDLNNLGLDFVIVKDATCGIITEGDLKKDIVLSTTVIFTKQLVVGFKSGELSTILDVFWNVTGGYFTNANCTEQSTLVTISAPAFTTGGGYINLTNQSQGLLAGSENSKNNFGFNAKWAKNMTKLTGNVNTIWRKDGVGYKAKSNKVSSVAISKVSGSTNAYKADIIYSNVNIVRLDGMPLEFGIPSGNGTLKMTVYDYGEPGSSGHSIGPDKIGIAVYDNTNSLVFSTTPLSCDSYSKVVPVCPQNINGGNIQVKQDANTKSELASEFGIKVYPNPFNDHVYFDLQLKTDSKVLLEVFNVYGIKLSTLYDGAVVAYDHYQIEYTPINFSRGMLIFRLTVDGQLYFTGKLIHK